MNRETSRISSILEKLGGTLSTISKKAGAVHSFAPTYSPFGLPVYVARLSGLPSPNGLGDWVTLAKALSESIALPIKWWLHRCPDGAAGCFAKSVNSFYD